MLRTENWDLTKCQRECCSFFFLSSQNDIVVPSCSHPPPVTSHINADPLVKHPEAAISPLYPLLCPAALLSISISSPSSGVFGFLFYFLSLLFFISNSPLLFAFSPCLTSSHHPLLSRCHCCHICLLAITFTAWVSRGGFSPLFLFCCCCFGPAPNRHWPL